LSVEAAASRISSAIEGRRDGREIVYAIERKSDNALLGWTGVHRHAIDKGRCSFGYWIGEQFQSRGYMTEAAIAVIDKAWSLFDVDVIEAHAQLDNAASIAILQKLGMRFIGERVEFTPVRNRDECCAYYEISRPSSKSKYVGEVYQHGHHASVVASHAKRTAEADAAFFLTFLKPGMRLLDVGCGPGSITVGLASRVAPGKTIGIDPSPSVIETAKSIVGENSNLSFEVGNIYEARFDPGSFNAMFAHQVLQHLRQPVDALRQMRTLLAPGGVLGVRDVDWGSTTFYPENNGIRHFLDLYYKLAHRNGGDPNAGRRLRNWLREAGFIETRVSTSTVSYADPIATREWAETYAARTLQSNIAEKALEYGVATQSDLEDIADGWRSWGRDPDAFFCFSHTEIVAWKR